MIDDFDSFENPSRPSKTQRKREMQELQILGQKLIKLNNQQLKKLALPKEFADAITLAQRLNQPEAIRRQGQYIGRLMREADEETVMRIKNLIKTLNK